ncbi:MAG: hypothetical protein AUK63_423 [bacterium P3]|nr:MAG: hypothetical protein AUK63_423 [bacterium P3]KWW42617.1 MAG: hypothetical protein F083_21 [bacterium F083]
MRRAILSNVLIALTAWVVAGCHHQPKEFGTHTMSGERCYLLTCDEESGPWGESVGVKVRYAVVWPDRGALSAAAERELQYLCFGDSTANQVEVAAKRWLTQPFFYEDEYGCEKKPVDALDEKSEYSYVEVRSDCSQDSTLVTFVVTSESYFAGAAHGMHSAEFLTIDLGSGNAVHLPDLVTDTNLLCEAIAHAIQDLDVNKGVRECLFDEFIGVERMPMPRNFAIDSARNTVTVFYGLYEIACYACGIQEVTLPVFWLSKHVPLTPYAKRLFGPGSSL